MTASRYETTAGIPTRAGTYLKTLDLINQLIDHSRTMTNPEYPRAITYSKMLTCIDSIIDSSAVIAHLHATEDTARDRALHQGWLAVSFAFQTIRTLATLLTQIPPNPKAWRDMTRQLEHIKHKVQTLTTSMLN